jgi:parvulin-like peptidyl-prolyl isomerase
VTRRPISLAVLPLALLLLAGCGAGTASNRPSATSTAAPATAPTATAKGQIAATVNGRPLAMSTYRLIYNLDKQHYQGQQGLTAKAIRQLALNQAIQNEVVAQYAAAHHLTVSQSEVNAQLASQQAQAGGPQAFQNQLGKAGLTAAGYTFLLEQNLITRKVADALFPVKIVKVKTARVWHILIAQTPQNPFASSKKKRTDAQAKALALNILHQVQAGGDFAGLARQYSDDPGSAQQGGDLGDVTQGQTVPPFDKAVFSAPLRTATLVKSQYGYHVLEVIQRGVTSQPSQQGQQEQQQKFSIWAGQQVRKAKIKRYVS